MAPSRPRTDHVLFSVHPSILPPARLCICISVQCDTRPDTAISDDDYSHIRISHRIACVMAMAMISTRTWTLLYTNPRNCARTCVTVPDVRPATCNPRESASSLLARAPIAPSTNLILSPMASPTLMHPPKAQAPSARPSTTTSTSATVSGSRTSTSSRPPLPQASSSYSSTSSYASASTLTSHSSTMPPPASPTPTPTFAPTTSTHSYKRSAPPVHIPPTRLSAEVWRLVGTHLSRRDLANLLYLRHPLALVAAERLAAEVEVWFGSGSGSSGEWDGVELGGAHGSRRSRNEKGRMDDGFGDYSDRDADYDDVDMDQGRDSGRREADRARGARRRFVEDEEEDRKDDAVRAMRTAHLLARVIRDPVFAARVRTLRVYFGPVGLNEGPDAPSSSSRTSTRTRGRGGKVENASPGVAFQTGMLANALPSLAHLRNVHITGAVDAMMPVLRILQRRAPKLSGLSLISPDSPPDLSFLDLRRLIHFSYTITGPNAANSPAASSSALQRVLAGAQGTLKSVALLNPYAAVGYLHSQPPQGAGGSNNSAPYAYNNSPPTATSNSAANTSYAGPIGHQQLLHPQPPVQNNGNNVASVASSGSGGGYSRHGQIQQQGQYPQYPLTHPYAPSPHQHALPSHARSLAPHPHSAHAHSAQTHASAMMSVHALAGGSGGSSSSHVGPASSGGASGILQQQRDQPGYRPRIAPAPPAGYTSSGKTVSIHASGGTPQQAPPPAPVPLWVFPTGALSIGNLTRIHFAGAIPAGSRVFADILTHGRHLETLDIECAPLECTDAAQQFLDAASGTSSSSFRSSSSSDGSALPFLTNFSFTVSSLSRRYADNSGAGTALFPAIAEFLRGRRTLRTLALVVAPQASASVEAQMHTAVGFDASVWGVLPSLQGALRGVRMTYPADLSAGLAGWLVPRSVLALGIVMGESGPLKSGGADGSWTPGADRERRSPGGRDWDGRDRERDRSDRGEKQRASREAIQFLNALKSSMPPGLRFVSLPDALLSILPSSDKDSSSGVSSSTTTATLVVEHGFPSVRVVRMGTSYWTVSRKTMHASALGYSSTSGSYSGRDASAPPSYESHMYDDRNPPTGSNSRGDKEVLELVKWPRHRALYHTSEWLAWYGCEDAVIRDVSGFHA
ncbi:hypothetical protein D9619_011975 [Psilocybe cf. subviscida]|uniref:Uncharacterized protein n=1 Tax=Psilocybe cf. subviscida TaxID=2480587 RepID=A0A8H5B0H7_9AGAR|nr:hypothetical protein D9619_011975 [Psilocybe cf. subviscida]